MLKTRSLVVQSDLKRENLVFEYVNINLHKFIQQYHPMDSHLIKVGCTLVLLILLLNCFPELLTFVPLLFFSCCIRTSDIFSFQVLIFLLSNPITYNFENQLFDSGIEASSFMQ